MIVNRTINADPQAIRIARLMATADGLSPKVPDDRLDPWMRHANILASFVRERRAEAFIEASGETVHASDCATSGAPATEPGPCDCNCEVANAAGGQR